VSDDEPLCPMTRPIVQQEQQGTTRWWCACGRSKSQPFCDGSHAGTRFQPIEVEVQETRVVAWCTCKKSAKGPMCDGSHSKL
jgi:CDGSH-type Zn-finger protein